MESIFFAAVGVLFGAGGFYWLTNWRLNENECCIKKIMENHLPHLDRRQRNIEHIVVQMATKMEINADVLRDE